MPSTRFCGTRSPTLICFPLLERFLTPGFALRAHDPKVAGANPAPRYLWNPATAGFVFAAPSATDRERRKVASKWQHQPVCSASALATARSALDDQSAVVGPLRPRTSKSRVGLRNEERPPTNERTTWITLGAT
jgi:hypothetical protein